MYMEKLGSCKSETANIGLLLSCQDHWDDTIGFLEVHHIAEVQPGAKYTITSNSGWSLSAHEVHMKKLQPHAPLSYISKF